MSQPGTSGIDPASIPEYVRAAYWAAATPVPDDPGSDDHIAGLAAALNALGCEWDDDQGNNSMRRIVGSWIEKEASADASH